MAYRQTAQQFLDGIRIVPLFCHFRRPKFIIASTDGIRTHAKQLWILEGDVTEGEVPEFVLANTNKFALEKAGLSRALWAPELAPHFDEAFKLKWQLHRAAASVANRNVWRGRKKSQNLGGLSAGGNTYESVGR